MWSYCTNTVLEEGGFDLFFFFLSRCVVLSQALLSVGDKWRGNGEA